MITGTEDLKNFSKQKDAAKKLSVIKSKVKNDLLGEFDSTGSIADIYSRYYRFDKDPEVFDKLMQAVDALTPADIDAYAKANFTDERRVVSTLWHDGKAGDSKQEVR
jgi:predicted Zn-dependent peptidase